jgi:signal transduction histidine kinase
LLLLTREETLVISQQRVAFEVLLEQARSELLADVDIHCAKDIVIHADPIYVLLAIRTALRNAVEATAHNTPGTPIMLLAVQDDMWVELCIRDSGPGFAADSLAAIGKAARSGDWYALIGHSSRAGGSGLGIPLMIQVARLHGGSVIFRNRTDSSGAEVIFRFPQSPGVEERGELLE